MKATDQLMAEHRDIKIVLQIFERMLLMLDQDGHLVKDHMDRVLEFFDDFIDKSHNKKEELFLFPSMIEVGVPKQGLIGVMQKEHREEHYLLKKLKEVYYAYKNGRETFLDEMLKYADNYKDLVSHHIQQEDYVLFPIAAEHISSLKQSHMLQDFKELEEKKIGRGKHQEFHQWIFFLSEIYLKENTFEKNNAREIAL